MDRESTQSLMWEISVNIAFIFIFIIYYYHVFNPIKSQSFEEFLLFCVLFSFSVGAFSCFLFLALFRFFEFEEVAERGVGRQVSRFDDFLHVFPVFLVRVVRIGHVRAQLGQFSELTFFVFLFLLFVYYYLLGFVFGNEALVGSNSVLEAFVDEVGCALFSFVEEPQNEIDLTNIFYIFSIMMKKSYINQILCNSRIHNFVENDILFKNNQFTNCNVVISYKDKNLLAP
ncbi:Hypothetical_protein [Hexamita inflata]|uniref:Hypothetical_protein n=1 Tax=Hexamita inflata TaxID=28002 RepID=A0ABP1GDP3_9EUKA